MDIAPAYGSPWLIAVNHVLHRLPVPRHSPCALCSLTFSFNPPPLVWRTDNYAILLNLRLLSFHSFKNCNFLLPFFKKYCDFSRRSSQYPISRLSFLFLVQFSRCDSGRNLISTFNILNIEVISQPYCI